MSCKNATAPIDINSGSVKGTCEGKCSYNFHYNNSSCVATNRGDYISIAYDNSSSPPVLYNSSGYDVQEIRLYTPSLHSYNDTKTEAELIIVHYSKTGSNPLLVCIPVRSNNTSSISANFFRTLVDTVAASAPSEGESTTVDAPKFNLTGLVPRKPFFSYTATEPYQPCSTSSVEYIVFAPLHASLDISPNTLTSLESIIQSNAYDIKSGPSLFFNEKGPTTGTGDGEIYIDCQPVDSSDETTDVVIDDGGDSNMSMKDWLKSPGVLAIAVIVGAVLIVSIILLIVKAVSSFSNDNNILSQGINIPSLEMIGITNK